MTAMTDERILIPLADGFEELEAVAVIDVLRRAALDGVVAGLVPGVPVGRTGIALVPDTTLAELALAAITTLVLPGGMPGTKHLMEDERILALVRRLHGEGRRTAAICAAPLVLRAAGVLDGHEVTSHPSVRDQLGGATVVDAPRVVRSGSVVTSQGAGSAVEFALALVEDLCGAERSAAIARAICERPPA
jgi:4-methyl-5(b-hydroxyethyl)-thiazole monophosphate biosynthesis